jgi:hypothetical protein
MTIKLLIISSRKLNYPYLNQRLEEIKNRMSPNRLMRSISLFRIYIGDYFFFGYLIVISLSKLSAPSISFITQSM